MQRYWLTTITVLMGALLVVFPLIGILFEEDASTTDKAVFVPLLILVGVVLLAGCGGSERTVSARPSA